MRKRIQTLSIVSAFSFAGTLAESSEPATNQQPEIKVLLIEGVSNHNWQARSKRIQEILAKDPSLKVTVSITPATKTDSAWDNWRPDFNAYDVVISGYNDIGIQGGLRWPKEVEQSFVDYVHSGGGFLAYHEANNAFPDWTEYNEIIGMGWRNKNAGKAVIVNEDETLTIVQTGEGRDTGHGPRIDVRVNRRIDEHPIYRGLPDSWMAADLEVYTYARGPLNDMEVLSYATDPGTGLQFPIEWTVHYGAGRSYGATYGHLWHGQTTAPGMRCAAFQNLFIRAIHWLADDTSQPAVELPFPNRQSIQLLNP